jgi:hypothetical protein
MFSTAVKKAYPRVFTAGRRMFSAGHSEEQIEAEVNRWFKLSLGEQVIINLISVEMFY